MIVILPMAGKGSRFTKTGIKSPKPLIDVMGKPMVWWSLHSLKDINYSKIVVIALEEHESNYKLTNIFKNMGYSNIHYVFLDKVTEGQLCTVLAARHHIDTDEDILVISSDTYILSNLGKEIRDKSGKCHGIISVANMPGEQWSFASIDDNDKVIEVAEKKRISNNASTGLYYFNNGKEFIKTSDEIISCGEKTKGEYFIIPVYQKYIDKGREVHISKAQVMWDMGNPTALSGFVEFLTSNKREPLYE